MKASESRSHNRTSRPAEPLPDGGELALCFHAADLRAATIEVARDVALVFLGCDVLNLHDRLEQDRLGFLEAVLHGEDRRHLEGEFVGVHIVVAPIDDVDVNIDDRVAGDDAIVMASLMPL